MFIIKFSINSYTIKIGINIIRRINRVKAIMDRLKMPEGEAIEAGIVSRSIECRICTAHAEGCRDYS